MKNPRLSRSSISRRRQSSAAERIRWVQAWERSDLTQSDFAETHGLRVGTLRNWVRQQDRGSASGAERLDFHEVALDQLIDHGPPASGPDWELEIRLPSGVAIAVAAGIATSRLRELLEAVRC